jgi:eukaryotic-like serine/threonine-protein kinase
MTGPDPQRVDELFERLSELPGEERERALADDELDPAVRGAVEELLAHYDEPSAELFEPRLRREAVHAVGAPQAIGPYTITGVIGAGAVGIVYSARQETPRREIAVKVLKSASQGDRQALRFEREAQLLGRFQHPGIAQIFESGTAVLGGVPTTYIALERVDGPPITEYAERNRLSLEQRVRLLGELAHAVHHAHLRGVIHRDLKPSNVLVTAEGQVKVIDFGVARALDGGEGATVETLTGQVIGTLAYMSPEQVRGEADRIDGRADVYALGVMSYELLSGGLPYDLRNLTLTEAARVVCDVDPRPLGARVPACRGDLERIVAMAMAKEPERRYQSAAAFADDLQRYLDDEPVLARRPSAIYELRKLTRRHRSLVIGAAIALVALLVGAGVAVHYAVRNARLATREKLARDDADREARRAEEEAGRAHEKAAEAAQMADLAKERLETQIALSDFQAKQLGSIDLRGMGTGIRDDVLAQASTELEREPGTTPADLERLERVLSGLNPIDLARSTLRRSLLDPTRRAIETQLKPNLRAQLLDQHAALLDKLGLYAESKEACLAALKALREELPEDDWHVLIIRIQAAMQSVRIGDFEGAEEVLAPGNELYDAVLGPRSVLAQQALLVRAMIASRRGEGELAEELVRDKLARQRAAVEAGETDPDPAQESEALGNIALALSQQGRAAEATEIMKEALDVAPGPDSPLLLTDLGWILLGQHEDEEALGVLERAVEAAIAQLGEDHPQTLQAQEFLARAFMRLGRYDEEAPIMRELLERAYDRPEDVRDQLRLEILYASVLLRTGHADEALQRAAAAAQRAREHFGEQDPFARDVQQSLEDLEAAAPRH